MTKTTRITKRTLDYPLVSSHSQTKVTIYGIVTDSADWRMPLCAPTVAESHDHQATLDILRDERLMRDIRKHEARKARGIKKTYSMEEVRKKLGL